MHACGAPLADGLLVGNALRCPWHHACFSLRTGKNLRPPAPNPISCWRVEQRDGSRHVYEALFLATGTEPIGLTVAGGNLRHAHYWRTLADSRAVVSKAPASRRAIVIGASFIG
ncbi:MAG TPA: Rieske 2Fe-2S domain-containing protein, partial [Gemmatimonadaceae bacterium]|nr:Rieske 2Fe-2S domain-containing protein [Gemmatimonadaceae bacterium]